MNSSANTQITSTTRIIDELKNYDSVEKIRSDLEKDLESQKNSTEGLELEIEKINDDQDFLLSTVDYNINIEKLKFQKSKNNLEQQILEHEKTKRTQYENLKQAKISFEKAKLVLSDLIIKNSELTDLKLN